METYLTGSCHCRAVQYEVQENFEAFFCHCDSCRRSSGAPFIAWGRTNSNAFHVTQGNLKDFGSSDKVTRSFCDICGTTITYRHSESAPVLDFQLATLNNPADVTPAYHIRVGEKLPWIQFDDGLPAFSGWRTD